MYVPTHAPIELNPSLRAYVERELRAVSRELGPVESKFERFALLSDFGAKLDAEADDTAAVDAAIAASTNGVIFVDGRARITSKITVNKRVTFFGGSPLSTYATRTSANGFVKDAAMTTAAFDLTVDGISMHGLTLDCEAGNTGDGLAMLANGIDLRNFAAYGAGQDGIRVADSAGLLNCNAFLVSHVRSDHNGRDGIRIDSASSGGFVNANVGTLSRVSCQENGGSGVYLLKGQWNVLSNVHCEGNDEYGIRLGSGAQLNTVIGGDREGNTLGQLRIDASALANALIGVASNEISDAGTRTIGVTEGGYFLPKYPVASLPSAAMTAGLIFVTDETGGAVPAFSDGSDWRRVTDRAVVS